MKLIKTSILNLGLAITIITAILLSGCSAQSAGNDSPIPSTNTNKDLELEPYEIVIYFPGSGTQQDTSLVEKEAAKLLKDINVTIRLHSINSSDWLNKKRMILYSAEKADLIFTASWSEYFEEIGRDAWMPLNNLFNKYGNDIKNILPEDQIKSASVNGNLYAIPVNKEFGAVYGLLFNKKLVDKHQINIKDINSLNDLEPILKLIKQKEENIIPFLLDGYGTPLRISLMNNYESIGSDTSVGAIKKQGTDFKVINQYEQEDIRSTVKMIYDWKKSSFFNQYDISQRPNADDLMKQDNYFCMMAPIKPGKDSEMAQQYGIQFVQHAWQKPYADTREFTGAMMSIPKTCKNPERTMMFLNRLYTDKELVNLLVNGIEGKHYTKISDNIVSFPDGIDLNNSGYLPRNNWMIGSQFLNYIWEGEDPEKWNKFKEFNNQCIKSRILGFTYNSGEVTDIEHKVIEVVAKYFTLYSNGLLDPDKTYDEFLSELKSAGVDGVIKEKQRQLDEWISQN